MPLKYPKAPFNEVTLLVNREGERGYAFAIAVNYGWHYLVGGFESFDLAMNAGIRFVLAHRLLLEKHYEHTRTTA